MIGQVKSSGKAGLTAILLNACFDLIADSLTLARKHGLLCQ